jgi:hypothetical protein
VLSVVPKGVRVMVRTSLSEVELPATVDEEP